MAKPKLLKIMQNLDNSGYINNSKYLGDIRIDSTILDNVLINGIYTFIGGQENCIDTDGSFDWSLRVYTDTDNSSVKQEIENLSGNSIFVRNYIDNIWSEWINKSLRNQTITLPVASWIQNEITELYEQEIVVNDLEINDKVDFNASVEVKQALKSAIHSENNDGVLKAITQTPPEVDIEIQLTIHSLI